MACDNADSETEEDSTFHLSKVAGRMPFPKMQLEASAYIVNIGQLAKLMSSEKVEGKRKGWRF